MVLLDFLLLLYYAGHLSVINLCLFKINTLTTGLWLQVVDTILFQLGSYTVIIKHY